MDPRLEGDGDWIGFDGLDWTGEGDSHSGEWTSCRCRNEVLADE